MSIKRMKKSFVMVLCALLLVFTSTVVCSAVDRRYTIPEIDDMTLYLPEDMTAITRSSQATDRYFSVFGLDYDATMQNFTSSDIYLQGMDSRADITITVTMTKTSESEGISNYNLLQSNELTQVRNNFLSQSEYTSCTPDSTDELVWLLFNTNVSNNGKTIKAYQANTVYDGMSINVTLQRNEGNVTAGDYATFSSIVSSVDFLKDGSSDSMVVFAIIGATVLVILLIIIIAVAIKKISKNIKKSKNDKIIEALADKYTSKRSRNRYADEASQNADDEDYSEFLFGVESEPEKEAVKEASEQINQEISEQQETEEAQTEENEEASEENTASNEYELSEFEEDTDYNNDEELVRMEAKRTKFVDSDDFFDEAPKKTMGVISSKDIRDAEDYDVITEVEKKAIEVEKPAPKKGEAVVKVLMTVGNSVKSFFVHCGYFCTNVSRMIKRRSEMKKRQKAEEERRQRAKMRAARERQQRREMQDGGLVQVRRRDEQRRPDSRNGRNRR